MIGILFSADQGNLVGSFLLDRHTFVGVITEYQHMIKEMMSQ